MQEHEMHDEDFSFYSYFVPFTTKKAIIWITIIVIIVWANMLFNGFVQDDITYVIYNPALHIASSFGNANLFNGGGQYRPFPALYFATIFNLFTITSFFYHFLQLALHIACSLIVFFIFKKFLTRNISFVLSLIFLVHPINVESVSYIAQTVSPLLFALGSIPLLLVMDKKLNLKY